MQRLPLMIVRPELLSFDSQGILYVVLLTVVLFYLGLLVYHLSTHFSLTLLSFVVGLVLISTGQPQLQQLQVLPHRTIPI